jgi:hypothetical protein
MRIQCSVGKTSGYPQSTDVRSQTRLISIKPSRTKLVNICNNLVLLVWSISKMHWWPLLTGRRLAVSDAPWNWRPLQPPATPFSWPFKLTLVHWRRLCFSLFLSSSPSRSTLCFSSCLVSTCSLTSFNDVLTLPLVTDTGNCLFADIGTM